MAYPNRTSGTQLHHGATEPSLYLLTPVDGGYKGAAVLDDEAHIVGFSITEETGVGRVATSTNDIRFARFDSTYTTFDNNHMTFDRDS